MTLPRRVIEPLELLTEGARILGVSLALDACPTMVRHLEIVKKWRTRINLTAITDPAEAVVRHFLDSLTVFKVLGMGSGFSVMDVGTGGGFPGVVLGVADGSLRLTLMDRDPRKIVFLKHLVRELRLTNVRFLNVPLAHLLTTTEPSAQDVVVSRAFSSEPGVLESLHVLVRAGGFMVRMGGPGSAGRRDLRHWQVRSVWEGTLPFSDLSRTVTLYARE